MPPLIQAAIVLGGCCRSIVQSVKVAVPPVIVQAAAGVAVGRVAADVQSVSVTVPRIVQAAAVTPAVLPLTVQSVSVIVPASFSRRRRHLSAELPLTVQSVSVAVPVIEQAAAAVGGRVAADRAVGQVDVCRR